MKKKIQFLFIFSFCLISHFQVKSQIFGNTINTGLGIYGANQVVWLKVITGASDSGSFTHFGIYNHPTGADDCDFKFAIYSDHPTNDTPNDLLVQEYLPTSVNGIWNEFPIDPTLALEPNTTYWIGLRFNCDYGSGREVGVQWADQPLKFKDSWSFFSSWPDPAGSVSTFGSVNNVALYLVGNNQTLPIDLTSFEVRQNKKEVNLEWNTSSEINNDGWNIQKSENGFSWKTIGWVEGSLNSSERNNYSFEDQLSKDGLFFYRLEQVDLDGQKSYSEVKRVEFISDDITLLPNPVSNQLYLNGIKSEIEYKLYNSDGMLIDNGSTLPKESIDVSNLQTGRYFLGVNDKVYNFIKI